jgi:hypothetical protein
MRFTAAPFEKPFFAPLRPWPTQLKGKTGRSLLSVRFMASFFQKQRVRSLLAPFTLVCLLLVCAFGAHAQSPDSSQNTPQATLTSFYRWYLQEFAKSRDPLHDDPAKIEGYVSKKLLREIDRLNKSSEGLDADYFIRAQDYLEDWASNIVVSDVQIKDRTASATVTLGATKESRYPLKLNLSKEGDVWKIAKVSAGHL